MAQESLIFSSVSKPHSFHTFSNQQPPSSSNVKPGNHFECRVCEESFGLNGDKVPRLLFCGHTLCHACLLRLCNQDSDILCPFDRQPTPVGSSGVWSLKKNFALLELLERLSLSQTNASISSDVLSKQKELGIACDEDESHLAVLYCTVCASHLCLECSEATHATKTLHIHKRIPLSEKTREKPRCVDHSSHPVEFVCLEESCINAPLMCFICKDYKHTKHKIRKLSVKCVKSKFHKPLLCLDTQNHKHALLDQEAEKIRNKFSLMLQHIKRIAQDITKTAHKLETVTRQLEGSSISSANADLQLSNGNSEATNGTDNVGGTAEEAKSKVRTYFNQLREALQEQENVALRVLDTHIRERICSIRQHQEDIASLLSQMVSVVVDGERVIQLDDGRLILASQDLASRLAYVTSQEQQLAQFMTLSPDPAIPITFTKDNRIHIGTRIEMRVVTLGLDGAGKTSILFKLKNDEFVSTIPTIGFNVETIEYKNFKFTVWDVGGQPKLRPLWRHYYFNTQAVIFVIDATNVDRLLEAQSELNKLMTEKELKDASLLIFANKSGDPNALATSTLTETLGLQKLCLGRSWHLHPCDAQSGLGLQQGLDWLARQLVPTEVLNSQD